MSATADLTFPYGIGITSQVWRQESKTAVFAGGSAVQRVSRKGSRWGCQVVCANLDGAERLRMMSFLAECEGGFRSFLLPVSGQEASIFPEILTDPGDFTGADWSVNQAVARADHGRTRLTNTAAAFGRVTQNVGTFDTSIRYCVQMFGKTGSHTSTLAVGTTPGGQEVLTGIAANERAVAIIQPASGVDMYLSGFLGSAVDGAYTGLAWASMARCGMVNGASQTGNTLSVSTLGANARAARGGHFIEVNGELLLLTYDLLTDAGATVGVANFTPALRESPPDGGPVCFNTPRARMILNNNVVSWSEAVHQDSQGHTLSTFTFDCIEAQD